MSATDKRSKKHVLDWTGQACFPAEFVGLVGGEHGYAVQDFQPRGHGDATEVSLESWGPKHLPEWADWRALRPWWLVHAGKRPTWDLVAGAVKDDDRLLILTEAKAYQGELTEAGKIPDDKHESRENQNRIEGAISEARTALNLIVPGFRISCTSHYQVANRIAYGWKLATMGLRVVLVYLGFLGDEGIQLGRLDSLDHWRKTVLDHTRSVVPEHAWGEQWFACGRGAFRMIIRARPVIESTPVNTKPTG